MKFREQGQDVTPRNRRGGGRLHRVLQDCTLVLDAPDKKATTRRAAAWRGAYLTQCINEMVLESQLPHKTVNLIF